MRLNSLRLVNFRQHADSFVEFDSGLTGIVGANGSGKSTILEAISWALYGNAAARGTRDSIRFNRAPARASVRVELAFELAGHRYRVVRGLTNAELYLDESDVPIANSISGVGELLQRRLGMTRAEFFNTYFTGQKELDVMAAMGPSERAQFLSRVLGYERLRTAQALVRDRRKLIAAEIAGLRSGMPDAATVDRMLADAESRRAAADGRAREALSTLTRNAAVLVDLAPRWTRAQEERERLQEASAELRVAESEEAGLTRDAERLEREIQETAVARGELDELARQLAPLAEHMVEFQSFEALAREEGRRQTLSESERALADELDRLRNRRSRVETAPTLEEEVTVQLEQKRREVEEALAKLEEHRTEWVRDKQEAETKRQALRQQYAELKEQRERLVAAGEEGTCPTCARPLGGHFRSVLDVLDAQLETVMVDGNYYKSRMEQLEDAPEEVTALDEGRKALAQELGALERRLAKVQSGVQELAQLGRDIAAKEERHESLLRDLDAIPKGYDATRHETVRGEIERLTPLDARAARLGAQVDREPQLARERRRVVAQLAETSGRIAELRLRRDAVQFSDDDYAALRAAHDAAAGAVRTAELATVAVRGESEAARAAVESAAHARKELARTQSRLEEMQGEKRMHDELDRAYTDIRTDLNFNLRPELSELASGFLTELTDGRYSEMELDDQYAITVLEDGIPKPVISGGEEDLANLVLRLAISQMIADRSGRSFSLLILDEVFGSLDTERRIQVIELLRTLLGRFEQVIVITHIESVNNFVDRTIQVRYDPGTSASVVVGGSLTEPGAPGDDAGPVLEGAGAFE